MNFRMNTRKCDRCCKTTISEEFDNHDCSIVTWNVQEIGITSYFEAEIDENRDQVLIAQGLNGILYRLVKCSHNPPHPETRPTIFDKENILRRLYRASKQYCYKVLVPYHTVW